MVSNADEQAFKTRIGRTAPTVIDKASPQKELPSLRGGKAEERLARFGPDRPRACPLTELAPRPQLAALRSHSCGPKRPNVSTSHHTTKPLSKGVDKSGRMTCWRPARALRNETSTAALETARGEKRNFKKGSLWRVPRSPELAL